MYITAGNPIKVEHVCVTSATHNPVGSQSRKEVRIDDSVDAVNLQRRERLITFVYTYV